MKKILNVLMALVFSVSLGWAAPDLVTVADKTTGQELSAAEFTQILDALKSGTRSATVQSVIINGVQGFFATGLEGTTAGDLATVAVAKIKDKALGIVNIQGTGVSYLYYFVAAGTDAESVPAVIRPNDFTTAGVWKLSTFPATMIPTLNQNTSGTAANLSGTPALPNGTTATTQSQADASTKLATTAYVDTGLGGKCGAVTVIDCSAGCSPTAAQLKCPTVLSNYGQAAADINNTLPAAEAGLRFRADVATAQAAKYWRFTSTDTGNMDLDETVTGKNYIQFSAPAVKDRLSCSTIRTGAATFSWACYAIQGTATTN